MPTAAEAPKSVNLEAAQILLLEQSVHGLEILLQMFYGFGARQLHKCTEVNEAMSVVQRQTLDVIVVDPNLKGADGHEFVAAVRRSGVDPNRSIPVIVVSANGSKLAVERSRDVGASFFVKKPVTPAVLLDRITRISRDKRPFIVSDGYVGPDRRFKFDGPPPGIAPRRSTDIKTSLGEATTPNMSQDEIDSLFKPQKVSL